MSNTTLMSSIYNRILELDSESVFVSSDFSDMADINTVHQILSRLEQSGKIQRIMTGVYYNPQFSQLLGEYEAPSPHNVALAIARKLNWNIAPSGNTALNQLGLSTQVPAKWSYISDGPYKTYRFNKVEIEFKHRNNKEISGMSYKTAMVIQALKELGVANISTEIIEHLKRTLTSSEKELLLSEGKQTVSWIYEIIKQICKED